MEFYLLSWELIFDKIKIRRVYYRRSFHLVRNVPEAGRLKAKEEMVEWLILKALKFFSCSSQNDVNTWICKYWLTKFADLQTKCGIFKRFLEKK